VTGLRDRLRTTTHLFLLSTTNNCRSWLSAVNLQERRLFQESGLDRSQVTCCRGHCQSNLGPEIRPFGWLSLCVAADSTINYTMDMVGSNAGSFSPSLARAFFCSFGFFALDAPPTASARPFHCQSFYRSAEVTEQLAPGVLRQSTAFRLRVEINKELTHGP
jgi:hypothetical protein